MEIVGAISTAVLAITGVVAAVIGSSQVREASRLRKASNRAYVVVYAEPDSDTHAINLVLENTGVTSAENVRVTFSPELEAAHRAIDHAETRSVWSQPLLAPGRRVTTVLDFGPERSDSDLPMEYEVKITYDSPATQESGLVAITRLDLVASAYSIRQWTRVDQDKPKQTRALESIARSLGVLADQVES